MLRRVLFLCSFAVLSFALGRAASVPAIESDSQCPNLVTAPDGTTFLTYVAPGAKPGERALRLTSLAPGATDWSAPRTIISSSLLFENWADFPSLAVGTDGQLWAQWYQRSAPGAHDYRGWFARSADSGATWSAPAFLGHEFVSLAPLPGGRVLAVWLENTQPAAAHSGHDDHHARAPGAAYQPEMRLLARLLAPNGTALGEWTVDPDTCNCCQTTLTVLPGSRVFLAYRGHTAAEIRDHRYSIFDLASLAWSPPADLHADGWKIPGCPVNGPAAAAHGPALTVAWFTAADNSARVLARRSSDAAHRFTAPVRVDLGHPLGRLDNVALPDGSALIFWLETGSAQNSAGLYARRLFPNNTLSAPHLVADTAQSRAAGFPRATLVPGGRVLVAWTATSEPSRVRLAELDPGTLTPGR